MSFVLSASKLKTAAEVRKDCKEMLKNPVLLMAIEFEAKQKFYSLVLAKQKTRAATRVDLEKESILV